MNAREAIVELLDTHGEEIKFTRSELVRLVPVNAGQLSNWLRAAGPLSFTKEGRVADEVLKRVDDVLDTQPPGRKKDSIKRLAGVLRSYGPRLRLLACDPAAARRGAPIAADNPFFLRRPWDEEVRRETTTAIKPVIVSGGPKTGKSSLLLWLQQQMETSSMVLFVDLDLYKDQRPPGESERIAQKAFLNWLAERCEDQVGRGGYRAVWNEPDEFVPWLKGRILPASKGQPVVLIFDHLDRLGEHYTEQGGEHERTNGDRKTGHWEFRAIDLAVRHLVESPERYDTLKNVVVVTAVDYHGSKGCPVDRRGSSLLGPRTSITPVSSTARAIGPYEMGCLLDAAEVESTRVFAERDVAAEYTGGQIYLAQAYAKGSDAEDSKRQVLKAARALARLARERWHKKDEDYALIAAEDPVLRGNPPNQSEGVQSLGERYGVGQVRRAAIDTGLWAWGWKGGRELDSGYEVQTVADADVIEAFLSELGRTEPPGDV